jgi:hypothetical protein
LFFHEEKALFLFFAYCFSTSYPSGYPTEKTTADMLRNVTKAKGKPFFNEALLLKGPRLAQLGSQRAAPALWWAFPRGFFGHKRTGATPPSPAQQSKK